MSVEERLPRQGRTAALRDPKLELSLSLSLAMGSNKNATEREAVPANFLAFHVMRNFEKIDMFLSHYRGRLKIRYLSEPRRKQEGVGTNVELEQYNLK